MTTTLRRRSSAIWPVGKEHGDVTGEEFGFFGRGEVPAAVGPGSPLLDDPGGQAGGRVVESVAEGLRLGRLDRAVATLHVRPLLILVDEPALVRRQLL